LIKLHPPLTYITAGKLLLATSCNNIYAEVILPALTKNGTDGSVKTHWDNQVNILKTFELAKKDFNLCHSFYPGQTCQRLYKILQRVASTLGPMAQAAK
jgi:hypothetical protein